MPFTDRCLRDLVRRTATARGNIRGRSRPQSRPTATGGSTASAHSGAIAWYRCYRPQNRGSISRSSLVRIDVFLLSSVVIFFGHQRPPPPLSWPRILQRLPPKMSAELATAQGSGQTLDKQLSEARATMEKYLRDYDTLFNRTQKLTEDLEDQVLLYHTPQPSRKAIPCREPHAADLFVAEHSLGCCFQLCCSAATRVVVLWLASWGSTGFCPVYGSPGRREVGEDL